VPDHPLPLLDLPVIGNGGTAPDWVHRNGHDGIPYSPNLVYTGSAPKD